jgi:hypothetical protein
MLDVEERVREMLRRRAADVPPHAKTPPGMLRRAWRRIVVAFTGGVVTVAILAVGAAAGVRLLNQSSGVGSQVTASACRAAELRGAVHFAGEQGPHLVGSLEVINVGNQTCSLRGQPSLVIVDRHGTPLAIEEGSIGPWWTAQSRPEPKGWPVVTLQPGALARLHVVWASWCGFAQPAVWRIWLRDAGSLDLPDPKSQQPQCEGVSSKVQVGPFEPVT